MAERQRPTGHANEPTPAQTKQAQAVLDKALRDLTRAHEGALLALNRIEHPVERAKAAIAVRKHTSGDLAETTDGLFRDAVVEAYLTGKATHGWYGYGALADQLGLSRARVQQIVTGTWKRGKADTEQVAALRADAEEARTVRNLAASGASDAEIVAATGFSKARVRDLSRQYRR